MNCKQCGLGVPASLITEEQSRLHEARGKCGGAFKPVSEEWLLGQDEAGYFVTPEQIASDANAPCFEQDERITSCPLAAAGAADVNLAFDLFNKAERGMLRTVAPEEELTAVAVDLIEAVAVALADFSNWRYEQSKQKAKTRQPQQ